MKPHKISLLYPPKILLAWAEAIKGNVEIRDWLIKNGYPELGIFAAALRNKDDAREWLFKNKFPHLLAVINGAEGNEEAVEWLKNHQFKILAKIAQAGDGDIEAFKWLNKEDVIFAKIAREIRIVKAEINDNNWDYHKMSSD
jgi:hypothetical protein